MRELTDQHIALIRKLAVNYQKKQRDLEEAAAGMEDREFLYQAKMLGGRATDRFRAAQQALIVAISGEGPNDGEESIRAATTLCECFDEVQLLFQTLLDKSFQGLNKTNADQT